MTQTNRSHTALGLVVAGALLRLMPHPPNVAPVGAMSLFAGARLSGWQAYLAPLLLMAVTDPIISAGMGYAAFSWRTPVVYFCFLISVWIGRGLRGTESPARIGAAAFACAAQFYLITNLESWWLSGMYPHSAAGLAACYIAALPFFGLTLIGNFAYSGLFFGAYHWLTRREAASVVE
ncbi:MAG: hypothetical protein HY013_02145 [Candidatus Solibacter usitatus]|nr:hypothetical protein [Candidatus Solibacter usitatus]